MHQRRVLWARCPGTNFSDFRSIKMVPVWFQEDRGLQFTVCSRSQDIPSKTSEFLLVCNRISTIALKMSSGLHGLEKVFERLSEALVRPFKARWARHCAPVWNVRTSARAEHRCSNLRNSPSRTCYFWAASGLLLGYRACLRLRGSPKSL